MKETLDTDAAPATTFNYRGAAPAPKVTTGCQQARRGAAVRNFYSSRNRDLGRSKIQAVTNYNGANADPAFAVSCQRPSLRAPFAAQPGKDWPGK